MAWFTRKESEFKPDVNQATFLKTVRMTQQQRLRLLKWGSYVLLMVLALVIQDVIMSQISILGATINLFVCVVLLITVLEGTEVGSLFVLIASVCYFFTGTAPGAYSIGILTFLGIAVTLLRQMYMNRNKSAIILAASVAAIGYELCIFVAGLLSGLTRWDRVGVFLVAGLLNTAVIIPLYPLIHRIGLIGGNTWKE